MLYHYPFFVGFFERMTKNSCWIKTLKSFDLNAEKERSDYHPPLPRIVT